MKPNYTTLLKIWMLAVCFWGISTQTKAQNTPRTLSDVKRMWSQTKPRVDGAVDISQIFYGASGTQALRQPYSYLVSGDFNFSMFSLSVPISFTFTNQSAELQGALPNFDLNQFGIRPTYKSVTLYAGHNSMYFSPYTMNGHIFLGAGVEVRPKGRWSVSALYGRFKKGIQLDSLNTDVLPSYQRMGYGTKVRYHFKSRKPARKQLPTIESRFDKDGEEREVKTVKTPVAAPKSTFNESEDYIELIYFGATDKERSLTAALPDSLGIKPEENAVLSARLNKRVGKYWSFESEVASSALTRDKRIETKDPGNNNIFMVTDAIFTRRTSTAYYNAYKAALNFNAQAFMVGVGYERIDPGYRTLGAYYFNNDLENITLNFSTRLFKNKLSLSSNVGTQRNNLDDDQLNTLRRGVGSVNVNFMPHPKLNINASYSGFQSFSQIRTKFDQLNQLTPLDRYRDSLKFTQISQNASLNFNYELSQSKTTQQYLNVNGSYQIADNQQSVGFVQNDVSRFYNSNVSYSLSIRPLGFNAVLAFDYNQNVAQELNSRIMGPTLVLKKLMLEQKLQSSLTLSQNNSYADGRLSDSIFNVRLSNSYSVGQQHMLALNAIWLNRTRHEQAGQEGQQASEFTLTFKYTFLLK